MNVLQYDKEKKPVFEMAGNEMSAPVQTMHNGRQHTIYPTLQLYKTSEMKSFLRAAETTFEPDQDRDSVTFRPAGDDSALHLTDRYFVRAKGFNITKKQDGKVIGVEEMTDPARQKSVIDANETLKIQIGRRVYGNVRVPEANGNGHFADLLVIDDVVSHIRAVETLVKLYDEVSNETVDLPLTHVFRAETEADRRKWEKAGGDNRTTKIKGGTIQTKHDYNEIEKLYDAMIQEVNGAVINGVPCTEENKKDWIALVPFFYKDFAIDKLFQTSALKNV